MRSQPGKLLFGNYMEGTSFSLNLFCFGFLTDVGQEVQPVGRALPGACPSSVHLLAFVFALLLPLWSRTAQLWRQY